MKRFACLSIIVVAVVQLVGGCGQSDNTPVNAREKRVLPAPPPRIEVTRWKQTDPNGKSYGMVIEQDGARFTASLYTLEAGEGLVIRERAAEGKLFPGQHIVFPLYNPPNIPAEDWVKDGGPHVVVPWNAQATNLVGTLRQPGQSNTYHFVKLEGVAPTYPAGTSAR